MRHAKVALQQSFRSAYGARRHASSNASSSKVPPPPSSKSTSSKPAFTPLPEKKMRALVSLYQKADNFISPSTLSQTIDDVFVHRFSRGMTIGTLEDLDYKDLRRQVVARRRSPKIGDSRVLSPEGYEGELWSGSRGKREETVVRTLFGVEPGYTPGLDVLEEESERIRKATEEEKSRKPT